MRPLLRALVVLSVATTGSGATQLALAAPPPNGATAKPTAPAPPTNGATAKPTAPKPQSAATAKPATAPSTEPKGTPKPGDAKASTKPAPATKPPPKEAVEPEAPSRPSDADDTLPTVGPREGAGQRSVAPEAPTPSGASATPAEKKPGQKGAPPPRPAHQKGPIPRKPRSTLPEGVSRGVPDAAARREIAGGATKEDLRAAVNDKELRALRDAERVLFPKPLDGARPGWSWGLPQPVGSDGPEIVASGPPPSARLGSRTSGDAAVDAEWIRTLNLPNLPVRLEARVVKYLRFYRDDAQGRSITRVWAQKSGRYVPALKAELAKAGLPTDLVWLSLIESGHNPTIVSGAGAAGLWQFMPEAGRLYGLTVDRWVDERLDPQRETEAAVRYLSDLYRRFGSWELAMAAYNMGYAGLVKAIRKFNTNDFWELGRYEAGLPWETTLYVPKIFAIAVVMNNKKAFGIDTVVPDSPVRFDTVLVDSAVPLDAVANAAGLKSTELALLNPQYLAGRMPPQRPGDKPTSWPVRLPVGAAATATKRIPSAASADASLESYVVRLGDTLSAIAAARQVSDDRIRSVNRLDKDELLEAGTVLLVPRRGGAPIAAKTADDEVTVVPSRTFNYPDREHVFYRTGPNDTLNAVADALGVGRAELIAWNALDESARLQPGMVLQAWVRSGGRLDGVRVVRERDTRVLIAGSDAFFDYFEGLNGRKRITVVAREGDSLRSIGRRYGMSVGWMERINRRSRTDKLESGEPVVVYAQRGSVIAQPVGRAVPTKPSSVAVEEPTTPTEAAKPAESAERPTSDTEQPPGG